MSLYTDIPNKFADWLGKTWAFWFAIALILVGAIAFTTSVLVKIALIVAVANGVIWVVQFASQTVIQLLSLFSLQSQQVQSAAQASAERKANHESQMEMLSSLHELVNDMNILLADHTQEIKGISELKELIARLHVV